MIPDVLHPAVLLRAYAGGLFPMADRSGDIGWYSPDPRAIIELDGLQLPRSLRQRCRRADHRICINGCFKEVIEHCADRSEGTWISPEIVQAYCILHELGFAHSVETYYADRLAGGLYGVSLGGAFFGESMFTLQTDASKLALVALVQRMRERHMMLLDIQFLTPHLRRLGAVEIPRIEYQGRLQQALQQNTSFG